MATVPNAAVEPLRQLQCVPQLFTNNLLLQSNDHFDYAIACFKIAERLAYHSPEHAAVVGSFHGVTQG